MHLAIGSNLCWKSRPDRTQAHWKPDEFGSQCFESTCVLRPHYDNIIHKCQYSLYGYLPTFHIGHVSAVGLAPTIFTKYISCLEVNWCFQTRNILSKVIYMSSYMWIRTSRVQLGNRANSSPFKNTNLRYRHNHTVLACFFSGCCTSFDTAQIREFWKIWT